MSGVASESLRSPDRSRRAFAGVLAAGQGLRFQAAGIRTPKALVEVGGRSLIERTLDAFDSAGLGPVTIVVNDAIASAVQEHVRRRARLHAKTTASTLETFSTLLDLAVAEGADRFIFTTVDSVSPRGELAGFAREAARATDDLVLGVGEVDPEDASPLRVTLEPSGVARVGDGPLATAGFYAGRTNPVAQETAKALVEGLPSLRAFLTRRSALSVVRGILLGRTFDVDTPRDVAIAEAALKDVGDPLRSKALCTQSPRGESVRE
jgi:NDP-sugar pyrophosphorylase family protein